MRDIVQLLLLLSTENSMVAMVFSLSVDVRRQWLGVAQAQLLRLLLLLMVETWRWRWGCLVGLGRLALVGAHGWWGVGRLSVRDIGCGLDATTVAGQLLPLLGHQGAHILVP